MHGLSCISLSDIGLSAVCAVRLRNSGFKINSVFTPVSSLSLYSFSYRVCKLWNALPKSFYGLSLSAFKLNLSKLDLPSLARGAMLP